MMKKKLLALVLALAMTLALAACGGDSGSGDDGTLPGDTSSDAEQPEDADSGNDGADPASESDVAYIQDKGTLIVGITDYAPMDYHPEEGSTEWVGFDADMARAFAGALGVQVEFIEINWDNKVFELDTKGIDAVWNGMTLTSDVLELMGTSTPYCMNSQVVVVPADKASQYQTAESLEGLSIAVENGSAGAEQLDLLNLSYTAVDTQARALMEVASGSSDACVIDILMAGAMIGEGTSYPNLTYTIQLNDEAYGVGFRKGSDLVDTFNTFWKDMYAEGKVMEIAEKYGVQEAVKAAIEG